MEAVALGRPVRKLDAFLAAEFCRMWIFVGASLDYIAHTTASDALWAGLPYVYWRNICGKGRRKFAARAANADLVTSTLREYEDLALSLLLIRIN
jgi:hypothetical protein